MLGDISFKLSLFAWCWYWCNTILDSSFAKLCHNYCKEKKKEL